MSVEPFGWGAVIVGAWNTAILTPDGIRRRLFALPDGTPVEIEIAIDAPGKFRVGHDGIVVVPTASQLAIETRRPGVEVLVRACAVAVRALQGLPETPVAAAGINVRYRFAEVPDAVLDLVNAPLDGTLSDAGFRVGEAYTRRAVTLEPGIVNVQVSHAKGSGTLEFNFHRDSVSTGELVEWLKRAAEFVETSNQLAQVLGAGDVGSEIHV